MCLVGDKNAHDRVDVKTVELMTENDYEPRGCTALLDAVGGAIRHIGNVHKYARREDVSEKTIFVIITDGMRSEERRVGKECGYGWSGGD